MAACTARWSGALRGFGLRALAEVLEQEGFDFFEQCFAIRLAALLFALLLGVVFATSDRAASAQGATVAARAAERARSKKK